MTNKQKLKTLDKLLQEAIDEEGANGDEPKMLPLCAITYYAKTLNAHHSYLLHLEERIEELEKKLNNKSL